MKGRVLRNRRCHVSNRRLTLPERFERGLSPLLVTAKQSDEAIQGLCKVVTHGLEIDAQSVICLEPVKLRVSVSDHNPSARRLVLKQVTAPAPEEKVRIRPAVRKMLDEVQDPPVTPSRFGVFSRAAR